MSIEDCNSNRYARIAYLPGEEGMREDEQKEKP